MGAIPPNISGLILGRSSLNIKLITRIIGSDSMGDIIVAIIVPTTCTFRKGEGIAQLLLLPQVMPEKSNKKWIGGFGSTDLGDFRNPIAALISKITDEKPMLTLQLEGKSFKDLNDTGSDVTLISQKTALKIGLSRIPIFFRRSRRIVKLSVGFKSYGLQGPENQRAIIRPHVGLFSLICGVMLHK